MTYPYFHLGADAEAAMLESYERLPEELADPGISYPPDATQDELG